MAIHPAAESLVGAIGAGVSVYLRGSVPLTLSSHELDWAATACNLRDLIKLYDLWPMGKSWRDFRAESFIGKKFECMASRIGGELFKDFDDDGYCDGFVQQIGRCGESCGYDMINLLPDSNTDILVIYKAAVLDVAEMLDSTLSDEE